VRRLQAGLRLLGTVLRADGVRSIAFEDRRHNTVLEQLTTAELLRSGD
jgi:hypothetical protein